MNPTILSLHPTFSCKNNCVGCYLQREKTEKPKTERHWFFFYELIKEAKNIGIEEVAVAINNVKDKYGKGSNYDFNYLNLKKRTKDLGMRFTVTTNYEFFVSPDFESKYSRKWKCDVSGLDLASISINEYVTPTFDRKEEALQVMKKLKENGVQRVNANILLSEKFVEELLSGLMEKILQTADTVYLLLNKPTFMNQEQASQMILKLEKYMTDERVILDSCFRFANDLTGGICDKDNTVYINPYGEMGFCPYASGEKKFVLSVAKDFEKVYNEACEELRSNSCNHLFQR